MANKVLQYEGDFRLWSLAAGVRTAINPDVTDIAGNTPVEASAAIFAFEAGDEISVVSKRKGRYGNKLYSDQQPGDSTFSLTLVAIPPALLARIYYGEAAYTTVTGAAVTGEKVTFAADALTKPLAHAYIASTPAPVVTDGASTTYTAGTDYLIDYVAGKITRLASGTITATQEVTIGYTYKSHKLTTIRGGAKPLEDFYITGDMLNRPDKSDMALEIYQAKLGVDGDVDLLGDEPITVTLTGSLLTPADKSEPYIVKQFDAAA